MPSNGASTEAPPAVFNHGADTALASVRETYDARGQEYGDTWALENQCFDFIAATLRAFGMTLTPTQMRLLKLASLIDTKDDRMLGPWKADSVIDGIAYRAVYATLRNEYANDPT